jgi:hypothetical protein
MTSPFRFKYPFPAQTQPTTSSTQLSARNFVLQSRSLRTPSSSSYTVVSTDNIEDIDDTGSEHEELPRKRGRYSSIQELSSDEDDPALPPLSSVTDSLHITTPVKRPPVILPHAIPDSPPVDFSPSRRQPFQPNGLVAYTAQLIHENNALSSVTIPQLDRQDMVNVLELQQAEGDVGWICRVQVTSGEPTILLIASKRMTSSTRVNIGDTLAVSNPIKTESVWICSSWHRNL